LGSRSGGGSTRVARGNPFESIFTSNVVLAFPVTTINT
jgi:hypothetical protein